LSEEQAAKQLSALRQQEQYASISDAAAIRAQELQIQETQLEERRAQTNLERLMVPAPMSGMVIMKDIVRGDDLVPIQNGDEVRPGQPYIQIIDTASPLIIEAKVNQVDVEHLKIGLPVRVGFDAYPDLTMKGTVHSVAPLAESGGFRREFVAEVPVTVALQETDERIVPGLTASADVILGRDAGAKIVPREAIFDDPAGEPYAFVESPDGWEKCTVELGLINNVDAAIRSGLAPGDVVALKRPAAWKACEQTTTQERVPVDTASR
jgi:multidrug efflux pump subunit AcrA (membrane-fusion protein)